MSKFCGNCGAQMDDSANVCGYCGTPCQAAPVEVEQSTKKQSSGKAKKIIISLVVVLAVIIGIASITSTADEPCDWCGHSPSVEYKTNDGGKAYVCKDCSKECAWCGEKAKKHYENYLEMIVFVCNDCYKDVTG